jgi:ketosteroid isomerase-like protein
MRHFSRHALRAAFAGFLVLPGAAEAAEMRPNVAFVGALEPEGGRRALMQQLVFDFAAAWANCDHDAMRRAMAPDVDFSFPTTRIVGLDGVLADLDLFCSYSRDTSVWFPADAFYIDESVGRVAVEVQFRTTRKGLRQVVNDVWVATVRDGRIVVLKEYLDGRVKDLQAQGVLELEESPAFLTPWPPRTQAWKNCFPIVAAAPTNACPPQ